MRDPSPKRAGNGCQCILRPEFKLSSSRVALLYSGILSRTKIQNISAPHPSAKGVASFIVEPQTVGLKLHEFGVPFSSAAGELHLIDLPSDPS